jgi:hypothetical protein
MFVEPTQMAVSQWEGVTHEVEFLRLQANGVPALQGEDQGYLRVVSTCFDVG